LRLFPSLQRRKTILAERDSLILEFIEYYGLQDFDKPPYSEAKMTKFLETTKKLLNAIMQKTMKLKVPSLLCALGTKWSYVLIISCVVRTGGERGKRKELFRRAEQAPVGTKHAGSSNDPKEKPTGTLHRHFASAERQLFNTDHPPNTNSEPTKTS
jgi:hypothetical protein